MRILGGALGNCIHVAGVLQFMKLAEEAGHEGIFLGPAVPVEAWVEAIKRHNPDLVAISYRLDPQACANLLRELKQRLEEEGLTKRRKFAFGGTPSTAKSAKELGLFERIFTGEELPEEAVSYLKGTERRKGAREFGSTLLERLKQKAPQPLLRHHLGLPTLKQTVEAAKEIALSEALDVLSIAPDQNAQESFFKPSEMRPELDGAGGVPLRRPQDLLAIYQATRCGNFPLLRIYAGTCDLIKWAELAQRTIKNAWAAIPLFWYSTLDGRSRRPLHEAICENQEAIKWHAERGIPVEVNDAHQWSLRDAPDSVVVAAFFIAAYNAKKLGVSQYIAQYMFNSPPWMAGFNDLARMMAKRELIKSLEDERFTVIRQARTGLYALSTDPDLAKGQLAASIFSSCWIEPQIVHVVGYCEARHPATAKEVVESCKIAKGVISMFQNDAPDARHDPKVLNRKKQILEEARLLLRAIEAIREEESDDPLCDPKGLVLAVRMGLLDAPHLVGNPEAAGRTVTRKVGSAVTAVSPSTGEPLSERERIHLALEASKEVPSLRSIAERVEKRLK